MFPIVRSRRDVSIVLSRELPRYFNREEVNTILEGVTGDPKKYLLISLLWQTGARVTEILNLGVKDIDFHGKAIRVKTLKQKKDHERVIPAQGSLLGLLGAHIAQEGLKREDRVLDITRQRAHQIVREAVLKAGLDEERAHPHTLRHSFAVHCVLSGVPVLVLKEWLGHSNIQNTLIYLKVLGSDTRHFYDRLGF